MNGASAEEPLASRIPLTARRAASLVGQDPLSSSRATSGVMRDFAPFSDRRHHDPDMSAYKHRKSGTANRKIQ
jgi:hypothetical protein